MDLESLQADFNALKKLYELLQMDTSGGQSAISDFLDEESRVFLKKLLDDAAKKAFEAHLKLMTDNWRNLLGTKCIAKSSKLDQNIEETLSASHLKDKQPLEFMMSGELSFGTCEHYNKLEEAIKTQHTDNTSAQGCDLRVPGWKSKENLSLEFVSNHGLLDQIDFKSIDKGPIASPIKEAEDKATKEVYNAIGRIESLIPSLHRLAKPSKASTKKKMSNPNSSSKATLVLDLDSVGSSSVRNDEVVARTKQTQPKQEDQALRLLPPSMERVDMQDSVRRLDQVQHKGSDFFEKRTPSRKNARFEENDDWSPQGTYLSGSNESEESYSNSPNSSSWITMDTTASSSSTQSNTTQTTIGFSGENDEESRSSNYKDVDSNSSKTRSFTSRSSRSIYHPSSNNDIDYGGGDDELDPSKYDQSSHPSLPCRKASKFKRLKNKIGLVFHHHHHHHHHHHGKSDEAPVGPWKWFGNMFSHVETKTETKNPKINTGKKGKHLAKSKPHKQQIGHFHALLEGLMRHKKRSNNKVAKAAWEED